MKNKFVHYGCALKLKKLGYDEPSFAWTMIGYEDYVIAPFENYNTEERKEKCLQIPTWDEVFNWFREKHNIDSYIYPYTTDHMKTYRFKIETTNESDNLLDNYGDFADYVSAKNVLIYSLIQILNERKMFEEAKIKYGF